MTARHRIDDGPRTGLWLLYLAASYWLLSRHTSWPWMTDSLLWVAAIGAVLLVAGAFVSVHSSGGIEAFAFLVALAGTALAGGALMYAGFKLALPAFVAMLALSTIGDVARVGRALSDAAMSTDREDLAARRVARAVALRYLSGIPAAVAMAPSFDWASVWTHSYRSGSRARRFVMRTCAPFVLRRHFREEDVLRSLRILRHE